MTMGVVIKSGCSFTCVPLVTPYVMQLYEDTLKLLNEFEVRLGSTQRGPTLGHQTNDAGRDLLVIF